jgi:NAD+ diphosphatase
LGFFAEATTAAITIDPHELLDARWFTAAELANPEAHGFELPPPMSIARRLIQDWLG